MDESQREKLGAATGIGAVIVIVASFVFGIGEPPGFGDSPEQVATFVADNRGELQAATALTVVAGVLVIWFLGSLFHALRSAEGAGRARLAMVAFAGGLLTYVFAGVGTALQWAAAYHPGLDPVVIQALWDAGNVCFLFSLGPGAAVLIGASSLLALRTGALPRLLAGYGALLAVYAIVVTTVAAFSETGAFSPSDGALGFLAFLAFLVWLLATSIVLVGRAGQEPSSAPSG